MANILQSLEQLVRNIINEKAYPVLAKVDKVDTKEYYCDCIELTNNGQETKTIYTRVKIPKLWGADESGIFMSPSKGAIVLLNFLNGDRNYPIISAVIGGQSSHDAKENACIIKIGETEIRLDDKIFISAGGKDLGKLLIDICNKISELKTTGSPTTQVMSPDQVSDWKMFVEQEIKSLFSIK